MTDWKKVIERIDSYREDMIQLQIGLTSIPALSPDNGGTGEYDKSIFLINTLKNIGFLDIHVCNASDDRVPSGVRPNIIASLPGSGKGASWVMTHMDVVPPGERSFWSADPYLAYEKEGRIFGRGTEDNQQDLVASIFAAKACIDEGISHSSTIRLAFLADEETGSRFGLEYLLDREKALFRESDIFVVPDSGSEDGTKIEIAEKSLLWLRFKTTGKQCHASRPGLGRNAFRAASHLIVRMQSLHEIFGAVNKLFDPPVSTFEPTKKDPNISNVNTIPGEDVFYMDCRVLPLYPLSQVLAEIRKLADNIEREFSVSVEITSVQEAQAPPPTKLSAPVVLLLQNAIQEIYNVAPVPVGIGGGTVAACLRRRGLPAAVWCRIGNSAHQPDESCLIENMIGNAKVYAYVFCMS